MSNRVDDEIITWPHRNDGPVVDPAFITTVHLWGSRVDVQHRCAVASYASVEIRKPGDLWASSLTIVANDPMTLRLLGDQFAAASRELEAAQFAREQRERGL